MYNCNCLKMLDQGISPHIESNKACIPTAAEQSFLLQVHNRHNCASTNLPSHSHRIIIKDHTLFDAKQASNSDTVNSEYSETKSKRSLVGLCTLLSLTVHWPSAFCWKTQCLREIIKGQVFDTSWYVRSNPRPTVT